MTQQSVEEVYSKLRQGIFNASTSPPRLLGPGTPPFPGFYKTSYVTADLSVAASRFFSTFGTPSFARTGHQRVDLGDGRVAEIEVATAWVGALQLELIQPIVDDTGYYAALLPRNKALTALHSMSRLFESEECAKEAAGRLRRLGHVATDVSSGANGRKFSADLRSLLGHYIEGIVLEPGEREELALIPQLGMQGNGVATMGPRPAPFPGFYQFTYITNDFDRAIALFKEIHGIEGFLEIRPLEVALLNGQLARMNCALTYVGAMELELMNPIDGAVSIYTDMILSSEFTIRHHHTSRVFEDYRSFDQRADEFAREGKHILANNDPGTTDRSRFYYVDCRDELGHYLESSIFDDPTRTWINTIPRQ